MAAAESTASQNGQVVVEPTETEDNGITLMDLFRIVRKHIVVGIITFVVVFAAVCAYTFPGSAEIFGHFPCVRHVQRFLGAG